MSISLDNACQNIFEDKNWFSKYFICLCILGIPVLFQVIFNVDAKSMANASSTADIAKIFGYMATAGIGGIFSFISGILANGYMLTYLRNLLVHKNSGLPDWKSNITDIIKSSLLMYVFSLIAVIGLFLLIMPVGIIFGVLYAISHSVIALVLLIAVFSILLIYVCLWFIPVMINFAEKNFDFPALFDFKTAKKYFCTDYFNVIGMIFLLGLVAIIPFIILIVASAVAKTQIIMIFSMFVYMITFSFLPLIYTNLYAQLYYSVIEKDK